MARNEAEEHFETYLSGRTLSFEYELPAGRSNPDYWLPRSEPRVVCEVAHVTASLWDRPGRIGAFDAYKPLGKAVRRKSAQGRGLPPDLPYVVVLWVPSWTTDDLTVMGSLFGKVEITMPVDVSTGTADSDQRQLGFGQNRVLQGEREHISAVSILKRFNPGVRQAEDEYDAIDTDLMTRDEKIRTLFEIYERRGRDGLLDDDARTPRLVTFHNPGATAPLGLDVFDGPYDEQYSVVGDSYTKVIQGTGVNQLPK